MSWTSWKTCSFDGEPAVFSPAGAFAFRDGAWVPVNSAEVAMDARPLSADAFRAKFGELPPPPAYGDLQAGH